MAEHAEDLIRSSGARVTAARVGVLDFLLQQPNAVTHLQIETALDGPRRMDRVTLYRALDWLIAQGFVHKVVSLDRVWRYRANVAEVSHHNHAHFQCSGCGMMICLDKTRASLQALELPDGFRALSVDMTVKGLCSACA